MPLISIINSYNRLCVCVCVCVYARALSGAKSINLIIYLINKESV